jgi:hypothetical protein
MKARFLYFCGGCIVIAGIGAGVQFLKQGGGHTCDASTSECGASIIASGEPDSNPTTTSAAVALGIPAGSNQRPLQVSRPAMELAHDKESAGSAEKPSADCAALLRDRSKQDLGSVLDRILMANSADDADLASSLARSLRPPTSTDSVEVFLDLLLGNGRYAAYRGQLPDQLRSALREAIRAAPDRQGIGKLAAQIYVDLEASGREEAAVELFYDVAHPVMLSTLAVKAYQNGLPQDAAQFLDRLGEVGDQGTVQAFVEAAAQEPALFKDAAERLYNWSQHHQREALPGLFLEYLTDSTLPREQRIAAAYGLAGVADTQFASRALDKAIRHESDSATRADLETLRTFLSEKAQRL